MEAENQKIKVVISMIKVTNLTFSYTKDKQILHGLNFDIKQGEIFGFLGPNGSGKSTTQKILTRILKRYNGTVSVLGKELSQQDENFYKNIGVLFEFPYLYSNLSAIDNLKYFSSFYPKKLRRDITTLMQELNFQQDYLKKPVSSYSKGMKQRVNMARALIHNPKLLFLDEPTSGLDPAGSVMFRRIIKNEREKGTTIFLTTHNMMDAELLCDKIAFIADGNIVVIDTPKNLKIKEADNKVQIDYFFDKKRLTKIVDSKELSNGFSFEYDKIISIHSKEPSLEDIFIKYTGRKLV